MLHPADQPSMEFLLTQRPGIAFELPRLTGPKRAYSRSSSFPEAVIACMVEDRQPTQREVMLVAARIWNEWSGKAAAWKDVDPASPRYRKMIAAARFALGAGPRDKRLSQEASADPANWWRTDREALEH